MQLTITNEAIKEIEKMNPNHQYHLLLWYDTAGCGCGVSGMPIVQLTDEQDATYKEIDSNYPQTFIDEEQALFFANDMKLDFINGMFRLSSPDEILNPFISSQRFLGKV